jgi:hypothetical protein
MGPEDISNVITVLNTFTINRENMVEKQRHDRQIFETQVFAKIY